VFNCLSPSQPTVFRQFIQIIGSVGGKEGIIKQIQVATRELHSLLYINVVAPKLNDTFLNILIQKLKWRIATVLIKLIALIYDRT
jgi:hypothetical protein